MQVMVLLEKLSQISS